MQISFGVVQKTAMGCQPLAVFLLSMNPHPSSQSTVSARPLLRYHGGKWRLAPWIISHFPKHRVYVEPFGGGASVLIRKARSYAEVYNDLDGEVVNLFRVMRDNGGELMEKLKMTPFAREEFDLSYQASECNIERARRLLIRSYMGFGSNVTRPTLSGAPQRTGFRSNSNRSGNTPAHDWANYPKAVPNLIARLQGIVIENRDAIEVMRQHDGPHTLHYVDPPYLGETRDKGGDYRHEMNNEDHVQLADFLNQVHGSVVLSGYPSDLYEELYKSWTRIERKSFADGARPRVEVLWLKNIHIERDLFS